MLRDQDILAVNNYWCEIIAAGWPYSCMEHAVIHTSDKPNSARFPVWYCGNCRGTCPIIMSPIKAGTEPLINSWKWIKDNARGGFGCHDDQFVLISHILSTWMVQGFRSAKCLAGNRWLSTSSNPKHIYIYVTRSGHYSLPWY